MMADGYDDDCESISRRFCRQQREAGHHVLLSR